MASRAEARRRKILQNSEQRLQRLTGRLNSDISDKEDVSDKAGVKLECHDAEKKDESKESQSCREAFPVDSESIPEERTAGDGDAVLTQRQIFNDADNIPNTLYEPRIKSSPEHRLENTNSVGNIRYRRVPVSNKPATPDDDTTLTGSRAKPQDKSAELIRQIELTRLISCVMVALISRILLPTLLGYLVLKSSAVMFMVMEGALFTHQKQLLQKVVLPHKSNLMAGALLLCGLKPELIVTYNRIMGIASAVFEDLMIYYFTFIICHILVS